MLVSFFYLGSFSYTSRAGFIFISGVSLTHPVLASFLSGEFFLHIPCCFVLFYVGSFSYTSRAGFTFMWGVCLTHPVLASFLCWEFSYTSHADVVSLTHPVLDFFDVRSFFPLQSTLKTIPSEKSWVEAGPGEKCEKVTIKRVKEALEQPEQSRTKPNKNWMKSGHRNERRRKEMDLSSKQALAKKAKKWMDPSSANYPKDNHTKIKRAGWKMA